MCVRAFIVPRGYWEDVDGVRHLRSTDVFYRMYKPGLSDPEKIVLVLQMISRCKVAKSIPSFLPSEFAIAEDDDEEEEEEEEGGARDDHREVEDVMETDNDDEELSSEEGEEEEEEGSLGEREGAGGDAWWEQKFDQICARYNPEGELDVSPQKARAWDEHFFSWRRKEDLPSWERRDEEDEDEEVPVAFHEWLHESGVWDRFYRDVVTCKKNQDHCSHCREELREERERLGEDERCACCGRVFADDSDEESIYNPVEGYICSECDDNNNER